MKNKKIFWVDDDTKTVDGIQRVLEAYGNYEVTKVQTFTAAKQMIDAAIVAKDWPYGLLMIDVHLKVAENEQITEKESLTSGLRLHDLFRAAFGTDPVLFLTNVLHRVPEDLYDGPHTFARDKLEIKGLAILDVLRNLPKS